MGAGGTARWKVPRHRPHTKQGTTQASLPRSHGRLRAPSRGSSSHGLTCFGRERHFVARSPEVHSMIKAHLEPTASTVPL